MQSASNHAYVSHQKEIAAKDAEIARLRPVDLNALPYGYGPTYQDVLRGKLWMPEGTPGCAVTPDNSSI